MGEGPRKVHRLLAVTLTLDQILHASAELVLVPFAPHY